MYQCTIGTFLDGQPGFGVFSLIFMPIFDIKTQKPVVKKTFTVISFRIVFEKIVRKNSEIFS